MVALKAALKGPPRVEHWAVLRVEQKAARKAEKTALRTVAHWAEQMAAC